MEQVVLRTVPSPPCAPADAGRGLAPTAFKMSPLPGLKSQDGLEAFLCRCLRANCRVSSGVSRRFEMANTMPRSFQHTPVRSDVKLRAPTRHPTYRDRHAEHFELALPTKRRRDRDSE